MLRLEEYDGQALLRLQQVHQLIIIQNLVKRILRLAQDAACGAGGCNAAPGAFSVETFFVCFLKRTKTVGRFANGGKK